MDKKIQSLLNKLPNTPGVYKFKNEEGQVLYVGKAKNLKKRVQSYFGKRKGRAVRTQKLLERTRDIEWTEVSGDLEAIVLEVNLIKELRPKYNVLMKDDKNFVYIKITKDEDYPRIKIVRKIEKDGARYFGPKTAAGKVKKTLLLLQKLFKYRSCDLCIDWKGDGKAKVTKKTIAYPCLDFHIKRCDAPCIGNISPEDYAENIRQIEFFLEGKTEEIEKILKNRMTESVEKKEFEKAALLRDKLTAIKELSEKQVVSSPEQIDMDVFAFVIEGRSAYFTLFVLRDGKLINQENFVADSGLFSTGEEAAASELMESFLFQYYERAADIPQQVLIPVEIEEDSFLETWQQFKVLLPKQGKKHKLLELARKNAASFMKQHKARFELAKRDDKDALAELAKALGLKKEPKRIEAYDISHLGGTDTVASMVVFEGGMPKKADYRKFRIKKLENGKVDDYKSIEEVLERRLSRMREDFVIRKATKGKKKVLEEMMKESWNESNLKCDPTQYYIAYAGKQAVGILRMKPGKNGIYEMRSLYVREKFRRLGLAKMLMRYAIEKTKPKRVYIVCREEMKGFYKNFGFTEIKKYPEEFLTNLKICEKRYEMSVAILAYEPAKNKDASFAARPDLILIDGGKGQLSAALKVRDRYKISIPMIGLAKREEEVFLPGEKKALFLPKDSKALYLLQRVRDEAHRFAIGFQRDSRKKYLKPSKASAK